MDGKLGIKEFRSIAVLLKKNGLEFEDVDIEFEIMDVDKLGDITFEEFAHYCIGKALDLEPDEP